MLNFPFASVGPVVYSVKLNAVVVVVSIVAESWSVNTKHVGAAEYIPATMLAV